MTRVIIFIKIWLVKLFFPRYWKLNTRIVFAQAVHETGNFTSRIFQENKNLFGMKGGNTRRFDDDTPSDEVFAVYKTHFGSIRDYFNRQKQFFIKSGNFEEYMNATISSGYIVKSEESEYRSGWAFHFDNSKKTQIIAAITVLVSVVVSSVLVIFAINSIKNKSIKKGWQSTKRVFSKR